MGRLGQGLWWEIKSSILVMLVLRCLLVVEGEMGYKIPCLMGEVRTRAINLDKISLSMWNAMKAMD